jgi:hypothetical protein
MIYSSTNNISTYRSPTVYILDFIPQPLPQKKKHKFVKRKCKVGQIWKYRTGGVACIINVTHLDYAPQCEAIICRSIDQLSAFSRYHDGSMRTLGIMECELVELLGEWVPSITLTKSND